MFYSFSSTEGIGKLLDVSQYNMWEMGSQGCFNLQFLIMSKTEHLSIFFSKHLYSCSLWATWIFVLFFYSTGTFVCFYTLIDLKDYLIYCTNYFFFPVCHFPFFSDEFINLLTLSIILFTNCVLMWTIFSTLDF